MVLWHVSGDEFQSTPFHIEGGWVKYVMQLMVANGIQGALKGVIRVCVGMER